MLQKIRVYEKNNKKTITDEEEIFSDKVITLSYNPIEIVDGITIQINKLEIYENESSLYLFVYDANSELLPLNYSLKSEGLEETKVKSEKIIGERLSPQEKLTVNYKFSSDELITLYVKDKDENLLKEIEINLGDKEIVVSSQEEVGKISQVELKKYLNIFSELHKNGLETDNLLYMARELKKEILLDNSIIQSMEKLFQII